MELGRGDGRTCLIYLATDSSNAVTAFTRAFGAFGARKQGGGVMVRDCMRRAGKMKEMRYTEQDARDVLCDVMLMAQCDVLVHADSSVSRTAAIINKDMQLVHV